MSKKLDLERIDRGMKESDRLGYGENKVVDVNRWNKKFTAFMQKMFGDLASWTNSFEEEPYMAKHPLFKYTKTKRPT